MLPSICSAARFDPVRIILKRTRLWQCLSALGRLDEAIAAYRQLFTSNPITSKPLQHGVALMRDGRRDDAIAAYRESIRLKPDLRRRTTIWESPSRPPAASMRPSVCTGRPFGSSLISSKRIKSRQRLQDTGGLDEAVAAHRHALQLSLSLPTRIAAS